MTISDAKVRDDLKHVTDGLALFPEGSEPRWPVDSSAGILFAFVLHTSGSGVARVDTYDRTGTSSTIVSSMDSARKIIERKIDLWSTDPYSDECWAHHNNDDLSPTSKNTVLYLEDTFEGEFTQREFFGGYTLQQFATGGGNDV